MKTHSKKLRISTIILFMMVLTGLQAQESINSTGGNATGSGGSASYSIGLTFYETHIGDEGSAAEGIQQPYEIFTEISIPEFTNVNLGYSTYPNPVIDHLILSFDMPDFSDITDVSYLLFDIQGNKLEQKRITETKTTIFMGNLSSGTYLLKVLKSNKAVSTFKIIKNK